MQLDLLRKRMRERLNDPERGIVLCDLAAECGDVDSDRQRITAYLSSQFGLSIDTHLLLTLAADVAQDVAEQVVAGVPYGRVTSEDSKQAHDFLAQFSPTRRYYSTYEYTGAKGQYIYRGTPLLGTTIDEGLLVADDSKVGILWVGDDP